MKLFWVTTEDHDEDWLVNEINDDIFEKLRNERPNKTKKPTPQ